MSTAQTTTQPAALARPGGRSRLLTHELALVAAATAATWLHTLDEIRIGEFIAVPFGAANLALLGAWPRLAARRRATAAIAFGLFWALAVIPYHVLPLLGGSVTGQHVSGLFRLVGGTAMVALGIAILRRREPS